MNTTSPHAQLPRTVIEMLKAMSQPRVSERDRPLVLSWLQRILIDFEALDEHIALLQKLYRLPFRYPRPRRDCWTIEQLAPPEEVTPFPFNCRLEHDRVVAIADEGMGAFASNSDHAQGSDKDELAELLLNPFALYDLFDVIDDLQPEHWVNITADLSSAAAVGHRGGTTALPQRLHPSRTTPTAVESIPLVQLGTMQWTALKESIEQAVNASVERSLDNTKSITQPANTTYDNRLTGAWWRPALPIAACLACAASLVAVLIGLSVINRENALEAQIALLKQRPQSNLENSQDDAIAAFELQTGQARNADWDEIWAAAYSPKVPHSQSLDRLFRAAPDDAKLLIAEMKRGRRSDTEILAYLYFTFVLEKLTP